LLDQALETSFRAYTPASSASVDLDHRLTERRSHHRPIAFPDRRVRERRGFAMKCVA
jgi:hypothetical protein